MLPMITFKDTKEEDEDASGNRIEASRERLEDM